MHKQYILDKKALALFIKAKYLTDYKQEISPLKLNKSLYFLFGYWAIECKIANEDAEVTDERMLFDANFEAWQLGPVEVDTYNDHVAHGPLLEPLISDQKMVNFLNEKLDNIFKITDFGLVNITRNHQHWKFKYHTADGVYEKMCNTKISNEFISLAFTPKA